MPLSWFKKKLRPRLIDLARRRIGSTRRGPVQKMEWTSPWIQSHPNQGHFLWQEAPHEVEDAVPINHWEQRHSAFDCENFKMDWAPFVAEIKGAFVAGPSVAVITPDRQLLLDVSFEFSGWPETHSAMRRILFRKPEFLKGKWAVLATTGGNSYYHHMIECTPRIDLLFRAGYDLNEIDGWIVNGLTHSYQRETWQKLALPHHRLRSLELGGYFQCDTLVLPSLCSSPGRVVPRTAAFLQRIFDVPRKTEAGRYLYLPRINLPSRRLLDERVVFGLLQSMGFEKFSPENHSLDEQARIFSEAKAVVGPHGGGMTNLVFMKPGSLVVELFNPRYVNACYWRLAWASRCRYAYLFGESDSYSLQAPPGDAGGDIELGPKGLDQLRTLLQRELNLSFP